MLILSYADGAGFTKFAATGAVVPIRHANTCQTALPVHHTLLKPKRDLNVAFTISTASLCNKSQAGSVFKTSSGVTSGYADFVLDDKAWLGGTCNFRVCIRVEAHTHHGSLAQRI